MECYGLVCTAVCPKITKMDKAKIQAVTTAIFLETRKSRKDGLCPVKLRVTYKRKRCYYNMRDETGETILLSKTDYAKVMKENPKEAYKNLSIH